MSSLGQAQTKELAADDQVLVDMVDALFRDNDLDDRLWIRAQSILSFEQIMDTIVISGFYGLISAVLNVARTSLEPGSDNLPEHFIREG